MVAVLLSNLVPLNSAPASTSSHQLSSYNVQSNPHSDAPTQHGAQYSESKGSNHLDPALPDVLACEEDKKSAVVESRGEKEKVEESECEEEVLVESQAKEKVECSDEMSEQTSPKEEPKAPLKGDLKTEMEDADTIYLDPEDEAKTVNLMGQTVTYRVWLKGLWKTFTEDEEDIMIERMYEVEKNVTFIPQLSLTSGLLP